MEWTPGPWRKGRAYFSIVSDHKSGHDDEMSLKAYGGHMVAESVSDANANLIAAAPDLYELVELVYSSFGGGRVVTFGDEDIARFEETILKARGEA